MAVCNTRRFFAAAQPASVFLTVTRGHLVTALRVSVSSSLHQWILIFLVTPKMNHCFIYCQSIRATLQQNLVTCNLHFI